MFEILPNDIIFIIICNLTNIYDVINLSSIDKKTYGLFDDNMYLYWGRNLYTKEFWEKAESRTPITYKPYINMKTELLRIEVFQKHLIKHGLEIWNNQDFYNYWECLEKSRDRGTPPNPRGTHYGTHSINRVIPVIPLLGDLRVPHTNEEIFAALDIL